MLEIRKAAQRGRANFGWLDSRHTFSFGEYHDPQQQGFSDLLVINDDRVAPEQGFGTHPHRDMEIFSYVLEGALEHKDSLGTGSVIRPGDVQVMSAGTGVRHSEFNPSPTAPVHFLQIWIVPAQRGGTPRYQQSHFDAAAKRGQLRRILGPDGAGGALQIRQDAHVYAGLLDGSETAELALGPGRHGYVHVARGSVTLNGQRLEEGDGVRVRNETRLLLSAASDAEILAFDLRGRELPVMPG